MRRKSVLALLTLVTTVTMTACSFQFSTNGSAQVPSTPTVISVEMADALANTVDNADLTNKDDVGQMASDINDWAQDLTENSEYLSKFEKATLKRVVDGDTIVVEIEGNDVKVRMIGIDTPESVASEEYLKKTGKENTKAGQDASGYLKNLLKDTQVVYLQKDVSDTDRYGRLLRYVWLEIPDNDRDMEEISEKMLNGILVLEGIAEPVVYEPDVSYKDELSYLNDLGERDF